MQRGVASRIPKQIAAREVELGVISFTPSDDALKSISVMTDDLILVVSPGHPLKGRTEISIKDLGSEIFVAHNAPSPYRHKVIETFEKHKTKLNIAAGLLIELTVNEMKLERKLNIIYRRNSELSHAARAFLTVAKEVSL